MLRRNWRQEPGKQQVIVSDRSITGILSYDSLPSSHKLLPINASIHVVREELVEYYEKLTDEATHREQKALWHVRRRQLDIERLQFMQREEAALAEELASKQILLQVKQYRVVTVFG